MAGTYSIKGTVSGLRLGQDKLGKPYAMFGFAFTTVRGSRSVSMIAMGAALTSLGDFQNGQATLLLSMDGDRVETLGRPIRAGVDARQATMAL